jgi:hypothetical protein
MVTVVYNQCLSRLVCYIDSCPWRTFYIYQILTALNILTFMSGVPNDYWKWLSYLQFSYISILQIRRIKLIIWFRKQFNGNMSKFARTDPPSGSLEFTPVFSGSHFVQCLVNFAVFCRLLDILFLLTFYSCYVHFKW